VLWDEEDTAEADRDALRRDAAVIFQDFIRSSLPARDNIALGRHERRRDEAAIPEAALRTGAHEDVVRLLERAQRGPDLRPARRPPRGGRHPTTN
jgi:ABC-type multidrug transport system fused ATPase/permease subunit